MVVLFWFLVGVFLGGIIAGIFTGFSIIADNENNKSRKTDPRDFKQYHWFFKMFFFSAIITETLIIKIFG